jgi:hypothetical protein
MVVVAVMGTVLAISLRGKQLAAQARTHADRANHLSLLCRGRFPLLVYHKAMAQKYARASRFLWMPVMPDPPPPPPPA